MPLNDVVAAQHSTHRPIRSFIPVCIYKCKKDLFLRCHSCVRIPKLACGGIAYDLLDELCGHMGCSHVSGLSFKLWLTLLIPCQQIIDPRNKLPFHRYSVVTLERADVEELMDSFGRLSILCNSFR